MLLLLLLGGCGGGGNGGGSAATTGVASPYPAAAASCSLADQRAWLRDYMTDQYFWYDRQGTPDDSAPSMAEYFGSLLAVGLDRYSSSTTTAQFLRLNQEGKSLGYGYQLAWADAAQTQLRFRLVEPLSPLGLAGVRRGDWVLSIDGFTASQIAAGALASVTSEGIARQFVLADPLLAQRTVTVNSAEYAISPVLHASVLTAANGAQVGYLVYQEFNASGAAALAAAINTFRTVGISELVLDLRYNGGGSTTQARNMASLVGGAALDGQVFAHYRYNKKYTSNNVVQTFTANPGVLLAAPLAGLRRLVVIASSGTASASEMVINGLKPYMPVVLIGGTTFGKPYGSAPRDSCGRTYSAITIEISNALGSANFVQGFAPTCTMSDDVTRQWGDPAERRTAAALTYIATGLCPAEAALPDALSGISRANVARRWGGPGGDPAGGPAFGEILPPRAWVD